MTGWGKTYPRQEVLDELSLRKQLGKKLCRKKRRFDRARGKASEVGEGGQKGGKSL